MFICIVIHLLYICYFIIFIFIFIFPPPDDYPADPRSVAVFLKQTPGLGRTQIGEYLSKGPADQFPFHASVLMHYVDTFSFTGTFFAT
jgi:Sec7-like guanine-nucleotide exchange factor